MFLFGMFDIIFYIKQCFTVRLSLIDRNNAEIIQFNINEPSGFIAYKICCLFNFNILLLGNQRPSLSNMRSC